uniref:PLAC domain-containing protein n=1 Tax=Cyprinus carpio TaxID=7962 RepID=A0A8C1YKH7_CYPCA
QAAGRQSRQAEEEALEGVWGPWSEWVECSQSCGVGVSERRRQCMPPPQTPPLMWNRPAYLPPGVPNNTPFYICPAGLFPAYSHVIFCPCTTRSSSSIRPGQFGYGRVPYSLPLHRQNRHARHTRPERTSDGEPHRHVQEHERITHSRPLTQGHVARNRRIDGRSSRQVPHSYTHTIHRSHTPREPPPYGLQTPTNPNPEPWVLQNAGQPSRNEAERDRRPPAAAHNYRCSGRDTEYRRCSLQACPGAPVNSRAEQCAEFNNQEFMGRVYDWEPFTEVGLEQQCELTCRPVGYRFYVRQAERVRDGTPCANNTPNDVCVGGRCLSEGCDGVLGSGFVRDRCGVCGGGDSTCERVTGSFQNTSVPLGYHKILDIPPGATAINITERRASPNYLALRSGTGQSVVNGRWAVDPPGEYPAGGTTFLYSRPKAGPQEQGEERGETLSAPGPTTAQLQLYVSTHIHACSCSALENLGKSLALCLLVFFFFFDVCMCVCVYSGSQYREIVCVNRHTEQEVHERRCDSATKPAPEEEPCNVHPCPPFWDMGVWSECSVSCGWGVQQRHIQCRQSFGNRSTMVHPQRCSSLTRPNATQPCHPRVCSHWEISTNWSTCSVDCGVGKRTRSVRCVSDHGNTVNDRECSDRLRPQRTEDCHMGPCVTNWYFTDWTNTCSATCGPGVQRREVVCLTGGGRREGDGGVECGGEKPADMKACNGGPCTPTHLWYTGPWGQCNAACGSGTQRRDIICVRKTGSDFTVSAASECSHLEKPSPVQPCELQPCTPQWFTTEWSTCSRSCGEGVQTREVRCLTADKQHNAACDLDSKPAHERTCNTIPCSPFEDENCKDRRHNCVMVVQARLCVYSYYKTACCASCTQSAQRAKRH